MYSRGWDTAYQQPCPLKLPWSSLVASRLTASCAGLFPGVGVLGGGSICCGPRRNAWGKVQLGCRRHQAGEHAIVVVVLHCSGCTYDAVSTPPHTGAAPPSVACDCSSTSPGQMPADGATVTPVLRGET